MLELCRRARDASDGWFDPWAMPGGVDPTGLVKGWAVERALDEFEAGRRARGDDQRRRRHRRVRPAGAGASRGGSASSIRWTADRILLTAELAGAGAVATSGSYERGGTSSTRGAASPVSALLSATVIGHDLGLRRRAGHRPLRVRGRAPRAHLAARRLPRVRGGRPRAGPRLPRLPHRPATASRPCRPEPPARGSRGRSGWRRPAAQAAGSVSVTRVPAATWLSTLRSPPIPRSAQWAIARPSPEPPLARERAASPR